MKSSGPKAAKKGVEERMKNSPLSARQAGTLRARFERCQQELSTLDWLSEGSVGENHPGFLALDTQGQSQDRHRRPLTGAIRSLPSSHR